MRYSDNPSKEDREQYAQHQNELIDRLLTAVLETDGVYLEHVQRFDSLFNVREHIDRMVGHCHARPAALLKATLIAGLVDILNRL